MKQRPSFSHKVKYETYPVLAAVSNCYPDLLGRLSTRYSPVRRSTNFPKKTFSHDLHVLSTPPAFNLSQNQTLQLKNFEFDCTLQMYVCVVLILPNSLFNCQRPWSLLRTYNMLYFTARVNLASIFFQRTFARLSSERGSVSIETRSPCQPLS